MKRFIILIMLIYPLTVSAKLAGFDHAAKKILQHNIDIKIDEDGKIFKTIELEYEILKESAANNAATFTLYYDGGSEKVKIIKAKSIFHHKEYPVALELIEDKPLASSHYGFDQYRQILLAFANSEIGAKIYLKYQVEIFKVPFEKIYGEIFSFGNEQLETAANINIDSKIPLHIDIHDPNKSLKISTNKKDYFHKLNLKLIKPIYTELVNEPNNAIISNDYLTFVTISSLTKWEELALKEYENFKKIYQQPLPQLFKKIYDQALREPSEIKQLNLVISTLQDKIRYLGDWKTIDGGFKPRDLSYVDETRIGDCKDYASAAAVILTKLGYQAHIVIVNRGIHNNDVGTLPLINVFNHAMTKVIGKSGKTYWIDPTNVQTMVDGIFADIQGKKALVLDPLKPALEQIPYINPENSFYSRNQEIEVFDDLSMKEKGKILLQKQASLPLIGLTLSISEASLKDDLLNDISMSNLEEANEKFIKIPDLKSRILRDLEIEYAYKQHNRITKTNMGHALELGHIFNIYSFIHSSGEFASDIFIDLPEHTFIKTIIKNINVLNPSSLDKEITSPWLYVSRKLHVENKQLIIEQSAIIYKSFISNKELKSNEFLALKKQLEENFKSVSIIFTKAGN